MTHLPVRGISSIKTNISYSMNNFQFSVLNFQIQKSVPSAPSVVNPIFVPHSRQARKRYTQILAVHGENKYILAYICCFRWRRSYIRSIRFLNSYLDMPTGIGAFSKVHSATMSFFSLQINSPIVSLSSSPFNR